MGAWGTALYSDDLAADLRGDFRDLIGDGLSASAAMKRLVSEYQSCLGDPDQEPVFWLALADTGWRLGRLDEHVLKNALGVIESGADLARWDDAKNRAKREQVLAKLKTQLSSPPPPPKRVAKTFKAANDWQPGEVVGFRLLSGRWIALRVIGHHEDKGGRSAVVEVLDWIGESLPQEADVRRASFRREANRRGFSKFLFGEPRTAGARVRVVRTGILSSPAQKSGGFSVLPWAYIDRLLSEFFQLE